MKNTLSQRIQTRLAKMEANPRTKNRADFLANREDIFAAMADKWSMKVIWETLQEEGKIKLSYQAFTSYVKKYKPDSATTPLPQKVAPVAPKANTNPIITKAPAIAAFVMDKSPSKDKLL
jgi:hypothetical protein